MINQQLLTYISNQQESGIDDQDIKENLLSAGWREEDVDEGFQAVESNLNEENSTKAHQQIRKEATQDQSNQNKQPADTESDSGDSYREPIEDTDTAENEAVSESGDAASDGNVNPDETNREDTSDTDADENSSKASPKELESIGDETNPLDSDEEMKKMASSSTSADSESSEPMAIRTYYRDSKKAGGDVSAETDPPKEVKKPEKNTNEDIQMVQNEKIKEESLNNTTKKTASQNEVREISSRNQEQNSGNQMESVRDNISDNTLQNQDRSNQNKRRFSADKNVKSRASKKSISTNKKSSGSKAFSAVIFLLILVLVGGGGAYAYLNFYQTSVPEVTSDQMMRSLSDSTSFEFRIIADSADAENETTSRLEIEGVVDLDPDNQTESYYVITSPDENRPPIQASMAETEIIQSVPDIQQETIKDILLTPDFITLGEFQTEERLGQTSENEGINTNRFGVTLNSSQLVSDYATFHQALLGDALSEEALSSVQSTIGAFAPTQGQVWLDSETNVPYQITLIGRGAENQDVQINIQFRNHGQTIETTPSYEPQSIEEVIIQHFSDTEAEQLDENENDTETTGDDLQNEQAVLRQIDQLRINNIQQISVALRMFVTENGFFPDTLDQLISDENAVLDSIPNDPLSSENDPYAYGISDTAEQYHLGTTLQQITRSETSRDANFNSAEQGYANGFNGASTSCLVSSDLQPVSICYDITDTVE